MNKNLDSFNCAKCRWGRHCNKSNPAPYEIFEIKLDGLNIKQNTCFLPEVDNDSLFLLKMHSHYIDGHLMNQGGVANQGAYYLQAMRFIGWLKTQE